MASEDNRKKFIDQGEAVGLSLRVERGQGCRKLQESQT